MPTVTAQLEFADYLNLSPEDQERLDLLVSAGALEERLAATEERLATLEDTSALEERLVAIEGKLAALEDTSELEARLGAIEERLATVGDTTGLDARLDAIEAKFDANSGNLIADALPAIPASTIVDTASKVLMTPAERVSLSRLRPTSLSTPVATGVGKNSMFVQYTGNAAGKWTLDASVFFAAIENNSQPANPLEMSAPSGFSLAQPVTLPSKFAPNAVPGAHVACFKRDVNSTKFRV